MTNRISKAQLDYLIERINTLTNNPMTYSTRDNGNFKANIGHYHLYGAYGGIALHQTMNEGGGIHQIIGISTKRELYDRMQSLIYGLEHKAA